MTEHGGGGHPHMVLYQLLNVAIIFVALIYLFRKKAAVFFSARREAYLESSRKAELLLHAVQKQENQLEQKIADLDRDQAATFAKAEADAKSYAQQLTNEALEQKRRLQKEYGNFVTREVAKAKEDLRRTLIENVFASASEPKREPQA